MAVGAMTMVSTQGVRCGCGGHDYRGSGVAVGAMTMVSTQGVRCGCGGHDYGEYTGGQVGRD